MSKSAATKTTHESNILMLVDDVYYHIFQYLSNDELLVVSEGKKFRTKLSICSLFDYLIAVYNHNGQDFDMKIKTCYETKSINENNYHTSYLSSYY